MRAWVVLLLQAIGAILLLPALVVMAASASNDPAGIVEVYGFRVEHVWAYFMAASLGAFALAAAVSVFGLRRTKRPE